MIQHGNPPYLECSSKGDNRFSAFFARIKSRDNKTIEEIYQAAKIFEDGSTNLSIKEAKGRFPLNFQYTDRLYRELWIEYLGENSELVKVLEQQTGLQDTFGQKDHMCQATVLWQLMQLRNVYLNWGWMTDNCSFNILLTHK